MGKHLAKHVFVEAVFHPLIPLVKGHTFGEHSVVKTVLVHMKQWFMEKLWIPTVIMFARKMSLLHITLAHLLI